MDDTLKSMKLWLTFAGGVLVVAVLYWAQAVLVPFALAILLTFVLTPPVSWLQRWVGRVPAVLLVVTLVFAALGLAGLALTWQMNHLVEDLPGYRANIRTKIADVRLAGRGSGVEKLQETLEGIKTDLETSEAPKGTVSRPLVVTSNQVTGFLGFAWLGPVVGPLITAGLVAAKRSWTRDADHVASLLIESRNYFGSPVEMPRLPVSDKADAAGLAAPPISIGRGSA